MSKLKKFGCHPKELCLTAATGPGHFLPATRGFILEESLPVFLNRRKRGITNMIDLLQVFLSLAEQGRGGDKIRTLRKSTNTAESGPLLFLKK